MAPIPVFLLFVLAALTSPVICRRSSLRHHGTHSDDTEDTEDTDETLNEIMPKEPFLPMDDEDMRLALQHSQRVSEASKCEVPRLQVIHVNDHYPGKYYLPHCTLLHRCGKHAGCCAVESLKCVAAEKEKVTLYFYSVKFDGSELTERKIEKLVFTNHTRCACAPVEHPQKL